MIFTISLKHAWNSVHKEDVEAKDLKDLEKVLKAKHPKLFKNRNRIMIERKDLK